MIAETNLYLLLM